VQPGEITDAMLDPVRRRQRENRLPATAGASAAIKGSRARQLLSRAVAARQRLTDTEDALGRLTAGGFGRCEQYSALIPEVLLAGAPESRCCARCAAGAVRSSVGAGTMAARR